MTLLKRSNSTRPIGWLRFAGKLLTAALLFPVSACVSVQRGPPPTAFDPCPLLAEIRWEERDADAVSDELAKSLDRITELEEDEGCYERSG